MAGTIPFAKSRRDVIVVLAFILTGCMCGETEKSTEEVMEELFEEKRYNKNIRPNSNIGRPSTVEVGMYLQSIGSVSELKMEYTIDIYFRLFWNDPRLRYNHSSQHIVVDSFWKNKVWLPDPYFMNSRDEHFHTVTLPNIMIRISRNGDIFYSQRLSLTLSCNMDLRKFPMDTQVCEIRVMSYAFNTESIILTWNSVNMDPLVELPEYDVSNVIDMEYCTQTYISGTYSCLLGKITLKRRLSFYMVQTYIPSILIVVLSWVNFWLDAHATPARVSLGLLCVLTMTTQNSGILSTLPRVSYVKSIDVWSSACLVFVFGALVEFAVVNVQTRKQEIIEKKKAKLQNRPLNGNQPVGSALDDTADQKPSCGRPLMMTAFRVDLVSRFIFPAAFIIFNLVYWTDYLIL